MTEAVYDFAAINRRLNRKPEPFVSAVSAPTGCYTLFPDGLYALKSDGSIAALCADIEQIERELLLLDEVLTRACPR